MKLRTAAAVFAVFLVIVLVSLWLAGRAQSNHVLTVVAVTSAFLSALSATAAWTTVREMRLDRQARERPQVVPRFDIRPSSMIYLCLHNLGNGVARDVRVEFSPDIMDYRGQALSSMPLFQNGIAVLEPGDEFCQFFHTTTKVLEHDSPHQTKVTVCYGGAGSRRYSETAEFNLEHYKGTTLPPKGTPEYLQEISRRLETMNSTINKVIGWDALLVDSPEESKRRLREKAERKSE